MSTNRLVEDTSHPCEHPDCTTHARFQYLDAGRNVAVCDKHLPAQFTELPNQEEYHVQEHRNLSGGSTQERVAE